MNQVRGILQRLDELDKKDLNPIMRMTVNYIKYGKRTEEVITK